MKIVDGSKIWIGFGPTDRIPFCSRTFADFNISQIGLIIDFSFFAQVEVLRSYTCLRRSLTKVWLLNNC